MDIDASAGRVPKKIQRQVWITALHPQRIELLYGKLLKLIDVCDVLDNVAVPLRRNLLTLSGQERENFGKVIKV